MIDICVIQISGREYIKEIKIVCKYLSVSFSNQPVFPKTALEGTEPKSLKN